MTDLDLELLEHAGTELARHHLVCKLHLRLPGAGFRIFLSRHICRKQRHAKDKTPPLSPADHSLKYFQSIPFSPRAQLCSHSSGTPKAP